MSQIDTVPVVIDQPVACHSVHIMPQHSTVHALSRDAAYRAAGARYRFCRGWNGLGYEITYAYRAGRVSTSIRHVVSTAGVKAVQWLRRSAVVMTMAVLIDGDYACLHKT